MMKFSVDCVDYSDLQSKLSQKKAFRLADVKNRIRKVAFDVVRFVDSDKIDDLWQIRQDGEDEYIVAMYTEDGPTEKTASLKTDWKALPDNSGSHINLFYKDTPIKRIALAPLGIPSDDAWLVSHSISNKLATDQEYLNSFVKDLTENEKIVLKTIEPSLLAGK